MSIAKSAKFVTISWNEPIFVCGLKEIEKSRKDNYLIIKKLFFLITNQNINSNNNKNV